MNKADRKQVDGALALLHADPSYAARTLATIQRAGNAKTSREVAQLIEAHPGIRPHLEVVNGCYVPKPDQATRDALARHAVKANARRFTGEPMTGFGNL